MPVDPPESIVFLLHGIRASNNDQWVQNLEDKIKAARPNAVVIKPTYGYLSAAGFALPRRRRKNIRWFNDIYTEALAKHRTADFYAVAHSNGSYLLGYNLLRIRGMQFKRVALAGSVLPKEFPWSSLVQSPERKPFQVGNLANYRANRDWPVAILCNALRKGLGMKDVGTGGFEGFLGDSGNEIAYYHGAQGGHGGALDQSNLDNIVGFLFSGVHDRPKDLTNEPGYFRQLSNAAPFAVYLGLLVILWYLFPGVDIAHGKILAPLSLPHLVACIIAYVVVYVVLSVI